MTYAIPAGRMAAFETVVGKAAKKAAKLGVEPFAWKVVGETPAVVLRIGDTVWYEPVAEGGTGYRWDDAREIGATTLFSVEVTGDEPFVAGWRFVASIDNDPDGNVVNVVPNAGIEGLVAAWKDAPADCVHCGLNRNRKKTYLLADADNAIRVVGSTCVNDYFPGTAADAMARLADLWSVIASAADDGDDWYDGGSGRFEGWRREAVIERAAAVVREAGWLSKSKAEETGRYGCSTADKVRDALTWRRSASEPEEPFPVTDADRDTAELVIDWVDSLEPGPADDYLWNLTTAVARPVTSTRTLGLVVSAIGAWMRETARFAERAAERWVAVPDDGARRSVRGKVLSVRDDDGWYGPTRKGLVLVETPDGNFKLWGSLPKAVYGAGVGDTVEFTAALKRSDRDAEFGFWSRPTKARFVDTSKERKAA